VENITILIETSVCWFCTHKILVDRVSCYYEDKIREDAICRMYKYSSHEMRNANILSGKGEENGVTSET
jgi:hypothetical protein